jgi:hypothetical protein
LEKSRQENDDKEAAKKALNLFAQIYEIDIKYRDIKDKVGIAQKLAET